MVCGLCGALALQRLRVPAAVLIGTVAGIFVGKLVLGFPALPPVPGLNGVLQMAVGIFVGARMTRTALSTGLRSLLPASLLAVVLLLAGVLSALLVSRITGVETRTALFAAAPGGITEMSTVGAAFGADGAIIAAVHLVRLLLAILAVAIVSALLVGERARQERTGSGGGDALARGAHRLLPGLLGGVIGGVLGGVSPVPAGPLVGALCGAATIALWRDLAMPLSGLRVGVQALGGLAIGLGIQKGFLAGLADWAAAGTAILGLQMLVWALSYYMLRSLFSYETTTAMFSSAPGGMGEVVSITSESGAETTVVAFSHLVRLTATIVAVPYVVLAML